MSKILHRDLKKDPLLVSKGEGSYFYLPDSTKILDAAGGAAVTSVGHSNKEVTDKICDLIQNIQFVHSSLFTTDSAEKLASTILDDPKYQSLGFSKVAFYNSGSEANETALKLARQAFYEKGELQRTKVISRDLSYHGNTFGAMSLSGHKIRNKKFIDMQDPKTFLKVCPPFYRNFHILGETEEQFCDRLIKGLDDKFQEAGPENVICFFAETMIGGTLGCVMPPKNYFERAKEICEKYGALLIYDEIMCGSGRLGSFFAWEQLTDEDNWDKVSPHISTFGKAIGSGYMPLSGVVVHKKVVDILKEGSGLSLSRHTYQSHPVACAAGLAVQEYIRSNNLLANIRNLGPKLGDLLKQELLGLEVVADVRGHGFFWCVEFLKSKEPMEAFDPSVEFSEIVGDTCLANGLTVIPCHGCVDGFLGDHILISPSFDITEEIVTEIVTILKKSVLEAMTKI